MYSGEESLQSEEYCCLDRYSESVALWSRVLPLSPLVAAHLRLRPLLEWRLESAVTGHRLATTVQADAQVNVRKHVSSGCSEIHPSPPLRLCSDRDLNLGD
jgi:hypothetical protein